MSTAAKAEPASSPSASGTTEQPLTTRAVRGAAWALASTLVMRVASIAVTAVLARLLTPTDFGVFAVALAVYLVAASLAELGLAAALTRAANEPEELAPTVVSLSVVVGGGLALVMALAAGPLATVLGQPDASGPLRVLALCLVLGGVFAVPGAQLAREFRQDRVFLSSVVGFAVSNPLLVVLALHADGATAFAWSRVAGQLATGVVLLVSVRRRYRPGWRSAAVGPLLRFGLPLAVANLVNWTLLNADYLLLGRLTSAAEVGVYMIAFNVASWSTALIGSVLNSVVVPGLGQIRSDRALLGRTLLNAVQLVALVACFVGAMTAALAGPLVLTLFGPKWSASAPVLTVLSLYGILFALTLLLANVLVAEGRTLALLLVQLAWVSALVPTMAWGLRHDGLQGVAWAHVATIAVVALPAYGVAVLRSTSLRAAEVVKRVVRPVTGALASGATAWAVAHLAAGTSWLALLAGGAAGGLVYLAVVWPLVRGRIPAGLVPVRLRDLRRAS